MDIRASPIIAPQPDEAFTRLLNIVLSPGSPIYDLSVPKRRGKSVQKVIASSKALNAKMSSL